MKVSKYFDTITDKQLVTVANPDNQKWKNLIAVCTEADKIRDQFGALLVTSGLRPAKAHNYSQHQDGHAIDFIPKSREFQKVFDWIRFNMVFDQVILEKDQYGNQWIHFSYVKTGNRRMALYGYWDNQTKQMEYKSA